MLKLLLSSSTTLISLFTFFIASANARQITFGSGSDTIVYSTLSYTTYGGSYEHSWVAKNGKPCIMLWRGQINVCDRTISMAENNYDFDKQWDLKSFRLLPNRTKAERDFFHYLQTTPKSQINQGSSFEFYSSGNKDNFNTSYRKFHFVDAIGSNKVVCTRDNNGNLFFVVTSVDAPKGYLKTEVCYGKPAYLQLKDLDTSYQSIPAILKKNAKVYSDPYLKSKPKSFLNQNSDVLVGLHPTNVPKIWRIVVTKNSEEYPIAHDPRVIKSFGKDKFSPTYVSESEIKWITDSSKDNSDTIACSKAIDSVKSELIKRKYFVPWMDSHYSQYVGQTQPRMEIDTTSIQEWYYNYPKNRMKTITFYLSGDFNKLYGFLRSPRLMESISSPIFKLCSDVGMIQYRHWFEGGVPVGYFSDGRIKTFIWVDSDDKLHSRQNNYRPQHEWGYYFSP